jgi:hypothetical protein
LTAGAEPVDKIEIGQEGEDMIRSILTFAFIVIAFPAAADTLTLASTYAASGTNPDGSKYTGTARVHVISDTTFTIEWLIGDATYKGFGMRMNDSLAASYMIDGEPGLILYKVDGNGLHGLWTIRGHDGSGTETLLPRQ